MMLLLVKSRIIALGHARRVGGGWSVAGQVSMVMKQIVVVVVVCGYI